MKTFIATAAVSAFSFLVPAQCQTQQQAPAPAVAAQEVRQSAYGVTLEAQPTCAVFTVRMWNSTNSPRTATISVDGSYHSTLRAASQNYAEKTIYFPNNSGDHTVSVFWPGGTSNYRVWTNCS